MTHLPLAYVGPDTVLPVASALAAIVGGALLCWRTAWRLAVKLFRCLFRRNVAK